MSEVVYNLFFLILLICCSMCFYRISRGPSPSDRAVAIDTLGIVMVGFTALVALKTGQDFYMNLGLAWVILSFVGVIALAKHLEGKGFDE